jgi:hypothetical protein
MLNAFWRVAPSDRFNVLAILAAGVFFRASDLSSRTSTEVHARLFDAFFTMQILLCWKGASLYLVAFHKESPGHVSGGLDIATQLVEDMPFDELARDAATHRTDKFLKSEPRSLLGPVSRQSRCLPHQGFGV